MTTQAPNWGKSFLADGDCGVFSFVWAQYRINVISRECHFAEFHLAKGRRDGFGRFACKILEHVALAHLHLNKLEGQQTRNYLSPLARRSRDLGARIFIN